MGSMISISAKKLSFSVLPRKEATFGPVKIMSIGLILIILVIFLLGGFSGRFGVRVQLWARRYWCN